MTILKSELVISGKDQTGGMFAGIIRHAEETKAALSGLKNMKVGDAGFRQANQQLREQTRLLNAEVRAAHALAGAQRMANEAISARTGILARMQQRFAGTGSRLHEMAYGSGLHWMIGGYAAGHTARAAAHDAAEFEHQRAMMPVAGMTPAEVKEAVDKSMRMRIAGMSAADNLRSIGELRMVFGSTEHALEHVEAVQRAAASLKAVNPHLDAEGESYNLARSLELKGVSNDPEHFDRLQNMMVKAVNASRGKITGADFLSFTNRAGTGTTRTLSDFFYSHIAPTLIQEMTGPTAGRALATMRRQLLGGHMQLQSAGEWLDIGLLDRKKVEFNKIGNVKRVHPGAIVDAELFSRDPYAWIQSYLMPAIAAKFKKQGKTLTEEALASEFATLFSDRYAENMATILGTQKQRIEKDAKLIEQAMGTAAPEILRHSDPLAASRDLGAAVNSLLSALGSPMAKPAIATMNFLADWARNVGESFGKYAGRHPIRAMAETGALGLGLGYVGLRGAGAMFGMFTGLGGTAAALGGSATALTGAAAALDAAAVRIGVAGAAGGVAGGVEGAAAATAAKGGLGAWLARRAGLLLGLPAAAATFYFSSTEDANAGEKDFYKRNKAGALEATPEGKAAGGELATGMHDQAAGSDASHPVLTPDEVMRRRAAFDSAAAGAVAQAALLAAEAGTAAPPAPPTPALGPQSSRPDVLRIEPRPDISQALPPAKAEITGQADVKVGVEIKTEAGFWSRITSAISNGINNIAVHGPAGATGSTGSRGASMPEATAGAQAAP